MKYDSQPPPSYGLLKALSIPYRRNWFARLNQLQLNDISRRVIYYARRVIFDVPPLLSEKFLKISSTTRGETYRAARITYTRKIVEPSVEFLTCHKRAAGQALDPVARSRNARDARG